MGYFEACSNPIRTDATGQRVVVPLRWFGPVYLLRDDADVARVRRGYKWMLILSILFVALGTGPLGVHIVVLIVLGQLLWIYLLTRGLVVTGVKAADLPRVPRAEAVARSNAAVGKTMLWLTRGLMVPATGLFLWGAWEFRGIEAWIGVPLILFLDAMLIFDIVQQRSYNKSLAQSRPA